MPTQKLPPELISLVHHIELNKAGWWDKALDQLLIATLWITGKDQSVSEILEDLSKTFQVHIQVDKAQNHLARLASSGILMALPQQTFQGSLPFECLRGTY